MDPAPVRIVGQVLCDENDLDTVPPLMRSGVVLACAGVDRILFENIVFTWLHKRGQWMISGYRISQLVRGSIFIAPGRPASLYTGRGVYDCPGFSYSYAEKCVSHLIRQDLDVKNLCISRTSISFLA